MAKYHVLYNPKSGNGRGTQKAKKLDEILRGEELEYRDVTKLECCDDYKEFFSSISPEDKVILAGGDGTVCHFVNESLGVEYPNDIYYFACGSGNDFMNDIGADPEKPVLVNEYIKDLPIIEVKGKEYKFINGIGFGIDGYCCEEGDKKRAAGSQKINYTTIVLKGFIYGFKRTKAKVTVDGETYTYDNVWLCPTMNGRYIGGGMMVTPNQMRLNKEKTVTVSNMHCSSKLKTLTVFPKVFSGKHADHKDLVDSHTGHEIKVEFDRPTALQIDGETITDVMEYKVHASAEARSRTDLNKEKASV